MKIFHESITVASRKLFRKFKYSRKYTSVVSRFSESVSTLIKYMRNNCSYTQNNHPRLFCISYADQSPINPPSNLRTSSGKQEEIYSSLKKLRTSEHHTKIMEKNVTMIPLGSPKELEYENTSNGTLIRVNSNIHSNHGMSELVPKMRVEKMEPNRNYENSKNDDKRNFESWSGRAMGGRIPGENNRGTNAIRGYWERNIQIEQRVRAEEERNKRPKSYGFPKWRSTDALSASLVASNSVKIPEDSRIPEERLRKMKETDREAAEIKKEIHDEVEIQSGISRIMSKGKSLDSLNMQVDHKPWYDTEKIKSAVSRESIANIATSRDFFENASQRDWRSGPNNSMCSLSIAPPLPPKSDAIQNQLRQAAGNRNSYTGQNVLSISNNYDGHQSQNVKSNHNIHVLPKTSQNSIHRLLQQDSPQIVDPIEQQEVLLMLYLKQNMDIVHGLGIQIPQEILSEMDDLKTLPVELRICEEEPHAMFSPSSKNGRYQRKPQQQIGVPRQTNGIKYCQKKIERQDVISSHNRMNGEMEFPQDYPQGINYEVYGYHH